LPQDGSCTTPCDSRAAVGCPCRRGIDEYLAFEDRDASLVDALAQRAAELVLRAPRAVPDTCASLSPRCLRAAGVRLERALQSDAACRAVPDQCRAVPDQCRAGPVPHSRPAAMLRSLCAPRLVVVGLGRPLMRLQARHVERAKAKPVAPEMPSERPISW
jgi:hypothetical protein